MHRVKEFFQSSQAIETQISATSFEPFPYPTTPYDFLEYAELDLQADSPHALANSLANSKRAMDCELDYFLKSYGLEPLAIGEKWPTARKLRLVGDLGVVPNRILYKINNARNDLEHRFELPSRQTAENALDAVGTFVAAVDAYLYPVHSGAYFFIQPSDLGDKEPLERFMTPHEAFLQLDLEADGNIKALGRLHSVDYTFQVNVVTHTLNYLYLLTFMLHFHRFYMPNASKFFSKLKYFREDGSNEN
jgi:hypothetical protein